MQQLLHLHLVTLNESSLMSVWPVTCAIVIAMVGIPALCGCQTAEHVTARGAATSASATTTTETAHCLIQVDGGVWLDKPCATQRTDDQIIVNSESAENEDFAYIDLVDGQTATGTWSGGGGAGHAHDPLGDLVQAGSCWSNDHVRICVPSTVDVTPRSAAGKSG